MESGGGKLECAFCGDRTRFLLLLFVCLFLFGFCAYSCSIVCLLLRFWQIEQYLDITCPWCQLTGWNKYSVIHDSYKEKICCLIFDWDIFVHSFRNTRCGDPELSLILGKTYSCLSFQSLLTVSSFLSLAQLHHLDFHVVVVKSWPRRHWFTSSAGFSDIGELDYVKWSACICYKKKTCHIFRERL